MSSVCYTHCLLCLVFVMSVGCYVLCFSCPLFIMSRFCYVLSLLCPVFVMSIVCYVQGLSSVCLSRVWHTTWNMWRKLEHPKNPSKTTWFWLPMNFKWRNNFFLHRTIKNNQIWANFIMILGYSNFGSMFQVRLFYGTLNIY